MNLIDPRWGLTVLSLAVISAGLVVISPPSQAQTGKSLPEADLKKIDDITQTAMNAALARDFATWAALFLDDAVVNPPNEPAVKGRAAIRAWLEKLPPMTEFKLNNVYVEGREDLAYVLGTYTMTIVPPAPPGPVEDSGKFVTIVRRQEDGPVACCGGYVQLGPASGATAEVGISEPRRRLKANPTRLANRSQHVCEIGPRKDKRGVDLISDALPFGRLWYADDRSRE